MNERTAQAIVQMFKMKIYRPDVVLFDGLLRRIYVKESNQFMDKKSTRKDISCEIKILNDCQIATKNVIENIKLRMYPK